MILQSSLGRRPGRKKGNRATENKKLPQNISEQISKTNQEKKLILEPPRPDLQHYHPKWPPGPPWETPLLVSLCQCCPAGGVVMCCLPSFVSCDCCVCFGLAPRVLLSVVCFTVLGRRLLASSLCVVSSDVLEKVRRVCLTNQAREAPK